MSKLESKDLSPKSIRQKQILDKAEENPDASITEIAEEIPSATEDLVERVLDQHGDPAASEDTAAEPSYPSPDEISDKQLETLEAIAAQPDASQRDLAETLDVTAATVSARVNDLPGFDWDERREFVKAVLDIESLPYEDASPTTDDTDGLQDSIAALADQIDALERKLEASDDADRETESTTVFEDPELVHKVVHACLESDSISKDEELRILDALLD